jgi:hypothetical protein
MTATPGEHGTYTVSFPEWTVVAKDTYDWSADKHLTVPNPDFQNPFRVAKPIAPNQSLVTVPHRYALELQNKNLAKSFPVESRRWSVKAPEITGPAKVDPRRAPR